MAVTGTRRRPSLISNSSRRCLSPALRSGCFGGSDVTPEFQDAHEAAHALDIQKRFMNRQVTTPQIVLFGLTGGLLPCPAAFTVLLVCMQVKQFTLGFALVAAFSFGLALTMVAVGAVAAWSVGHAEKKFTGFSDAMRKAPYLSCVL